MWMLTFPELVFLGHPSAASVQRLNDVTTCMSFCLFVCLDKFLITPYHLTWTHTHLKPARSRAVVLHSVRQGAVAGTAGRAQQGKRTLNGTDPNAFVYPQCRDLCGRPITDLIEASCKPPTENECSWPRGQKTSHQGTISMHAPNITERWTRNPQTMT